MEQEITPSVENEDVKNQSEDNPTPDPTPETDLETGGEEEITEVDDGDPQPSRKNADIRDLKDENKFLRDQLDKALVPSRSVVKAEVDTPLPELDPELEGAVNARIDKAVKPFSKYIGHLAEENDELRAMITNSNYKKHSTVVERYRGSQADKNHYVSRQDAFDLLVAKGVIQLNPSNKPSSLKVRKTKVKVGVEKTTTQTPRQPGKVFKDLTIKEKEDSLGDKII